MGTIEAMIAEAGARRDALRAEEERRDGERVAALRAAIQEQLGMVWGELAPHVHNEQPDRGGRRMSLSVTIARPGLLPFRVNVEEGDWQPAICMIPDGFGRIYAVNDIANLLLFCREEWERQQQVAREGRVKSLILQLHDRWRLPKPDVAAKLLEELAAYLSDEEVAGHRAKWQRCWDDLVAERERRRAADLAVAEAAVAEARRYVEEYAAYQAACRHWAEVETRRLWRQWAGWHVRYVPTLTGDEFAVDDEVIREIFVLGDELPMRWPAEVRAVTRDGRLERRVLGNLLDASYVFFETPTIDAAAPHHVVYHGGEYYVNVPPTVLRAPSEAPKPIVLWYERASRLLDENVSPEMRGRLEQAGPEWLARQTPEQVVYAAVGGEE